TRLPPAYRLDNNPSSPLHPAARPGSAPDPAFRPYRSSLPSLVPRSGAPADLKKYWLLFAQGVTVGLAVLFVLAALRPEWLPSALAPAPGSVALPAPLPADPGTGSARGDAAPRATRPAPAGSSQASDRILSYADAA